MNPQIPLIPYPEKIDQVPGVFQIDSDSIILAHPIVQSNARWLQQIIEGLLQTNIPLHLSDSGYPPPYKSICLEWLPEPKDLGLEGYRLRIQPDDVRLTAAGQAGMMYACQTVRQLLCLGIPAIGSLPCLEIEDSPRFPWRGMMLDEARHFHGKAQVKRLLDQLVLLKMNILHWHLTDDQGWRIAIQRYPRLTEIGSQRAGTRYSFFGKAHNQIPHGGFYTRDDVREIISYAAERNITIVPEIELPGHSTAALAAYPELSCKGGPFSVATKPGIYPDLYCVGKDSTLEFLHNVLEEVAHLFPSPYLHIGGDEAPKKRWKSCPDCRRKAKSLGLTPQALQVHLTNHISHFLSQQGKTTIGWSEILQPGLAKDAMVQYWLPDQKKIVRAIHSGRKVIISALMDLYLDHSYTLTSLRRAYTFDPVFHSLEPADKEYILGIEAPLWSEFIYNQARLDYQVFPRLLAYAETGWSQPQHRNYASFEHRLLQFLPILDTQGIRYAPPAHWDPPRWRQFFGAFTILQPQHKTAP